jgi:hypothetical protein
MRGYDIDGTLTAGILPEGAWCVISGRTWSEYDHTCRALAQHAPVYIRGSGLYGDREDAARFKASMIVRLGVTEYWEDDPLQAEIIQQEGGDVIVHLVA